MTIKKAQNKKKITKLNFHVDTKFTLIDIMKDVLHERYRGKMYHLRESIREATGLLIDRRKMNILCGVDKVNEPVLSPTELICIDEFLRSMNDNRLTQEPLLFRYTNYLDLFKYSKDIYVYISTKYNPKLYSDVCSANDVLSLSTIMRCPKLKHAHIEMVDVFLQDNYESIKKERWLKLTNQRNIIVLGSMFANIATEIVMSKMFGVQPFSFKEGDSLPVYLAWPLKKERFGINSTFSLGARSLEVKHGHKIDIKNERAIVIANEVKISRRFSEEGKRVSTSYGIVLVQRQNLNYTRTVLLGTYGPTTRGMSEIIFDQGGFSCFLPEYDSVRKSPQPIIAAVIKVNIQKRHRAINQEIEQKRENRDTSSIEMKKLYLFEKREMKWEWEAITSNTVF